MSWVAMVSIGLGTVLVGWGLLVVLVRRLPPGLARDLAAILPACATTMWRLRRDPRVPLRVKVALVVAGLWVLSPIDLIPEFLPVIGPLDDVVVVVVTLRYAVRRVPRSVLEGAWAGDAHLLDRLLGPGAAGIPGDRASAPRGRRAGSRRPPRSSRSGRGGSGRRR